MREDPTTFSDAFVDDDVHAAAELLPGHDPSNALVGFGCSLRGKWFGTPARVGGRDHAQENYRLTSNRIRGLVDDHHAQQTRRSLACEQGLLDGVEFACVSFMDVPPFDFG